LGARTVEYLRSGVKACQVELTREDLAKIDAIVPPGSWVSDYFDANIYKPLRMGFSSEARKLAAGAFIPDNETGSGRRAGYPPKR
jgi:hypothetical protein